MIPTRFLFVAGTLLAVSACGGGRNDVTMSTISQSYATGPVQAACMTSGRPGAGRTLCGCVQAAADATLSGSEQRRAVRFFKDPHHAQEVRQSDRASDEAYWQRYKRFVAVAEQACA